MTPSFTTCDVLSAIQPTGEIHLGNYFGAIKNWVDLQEKYRCVYGVVDLHAMTVPYDPKTLKENTLDMLVGIMAAGVNPEKCILFIQSLVPEHTELTWYFNCLTSFGELSRQTQFKDKSEKQTEDGNEFISSGLFTYPVLQAADILVYNARYVPVGQDQQQHLELSRNIAERFNHRFGNFFNLPEGLFTPTPKLLSLADPTKKMSKSLGEKHYIGLFEAEDSVRKKVKRAVTDTGETSEEMSAGVKNLFQLLKACEHQQDHDSLMNDYHNGTLMYGKLKEAVAEALVALTQGMRQRKAELLENKTVLEKTIHESSKAARAIAQQNIAKIRKMIGAAE
ncbi:MAG: tryptophan--tRNA ligase [Chitinophagales bacterium]|nr:tryptophan--tRNA ligase [Bacteroidota bacterium]MCB9043622.1 tryptophan--tRNA ligase [Chitinophagales bacterium]